MSGCDQCGWPTRPLRTPADDCPLFGDEAHDSLNSSDCWGICDALCDGCARPVRSASGGCSVPPEGWACTRQAGHDGPCAAVEAT